MLEKLSQAAVTVSKVGPEDVNVGAGAGAVAATRVIFSKRGLSSFRRLIVAYEPEAGFTRAVGRSVFSGGWMGDGQKEATKDVGEQTGAEGDRERWEQLCHRLCGYLYFGLQNDDRPCDGWRKNFEAPSLG